MKKEHGHSCGHGNVDSAELDEQVLTWRMSQVKHRIVVLSGKGGVGKSTVAVNVATALQRAGKKVGLLDADIHGPSVPKLLHLDRSMVEPGPGEREILPVTLPSGLKVMSIGLLLRNQEEAVIWRGPMKHTVIKQFLKDVRWGELDYLVVDLPPGTGDEALSVANLIGKLDGALVVTTPQQMATQDVRRSITFCRQLSLPVVGIVENMSGFCCPKCGEHTALFGEGGGEQMAEDLHVPLLVRIPLDVEIMRSGESGQPLVESQPEASSAQALQGLIDPLLSLEEKEAAVQEEVEKVEQDENGVCVAVPVAEGKVCMHFGHCEQFALFSVDEDQQKIRSYRMITPPAHEPGVLPRWLHEQRANVVITGGMGVRAQQLFQEQNIRVVIGAPADGAEQVVQAYLDQTLETGANPCDH